MRDIQSIASLLTTNSNILLDDIIHDYLRTNNRIRFNEFKQYCNTRGLTITESDLLGAMSADNQVYYRERADKNGSYWVASLTEGYVDINDPNEDGDELVGITTKPTDELTSPPEEEPADELADELGDFVLNQKDEEKPKKLNRPWAKRPWTAETTPE